MCNERVQAGCIVGCITGTGSYLDGWISHLGQGRGGQGQQEPRIGTQPSITAPSLTATYDCRASHRIQPVGQAIAFVSFSEQTLPLSERPSSTAHVAHKKINKGVGLRLTFHPVSSDQPVSHFHFHLERQM